MKWLALAIGVLVTLGVALQFPAERVLRGQNDFLSLYCGATLSGTPDLRSVEAHKEIAQKAADIWLPSVLFTRPDYYAVLLRPLAGLPYRVAYFTFQILSALALGLFLWLFRRRKNFWMLALCSVPLVAEFANGQDVTLLMVALSGAVLLERRSRSFAAGLLLSACTIKFHLFIFIPIALLAWKKWRIISGACTGTAAGVVITSITQPAGWLGRYMELLKRPDINPMPFPLNIHGVSAALGWSAPIESLLIGAVIGTLLVLVWQRIPFETLLSMCLLGGLLTTSHLGLHDYALLLPCCALSTGLAKQGFFWLATPPVYIAMLLPTPWSALATAALGALLVLPIIELHQQTIFDIRGLRRLQQSEP